MIGRKIANFVITEQLGEGGMGTVYKATDRHLNRTVAVKMLHSFRVNDPQNLKRFQNEAHLSAKISHPNVATLYDFQQSEQHTYIVMEFVDGQPLDNIITTQQQLPASEAVKICLQVLEGLGAAHELGIMHRDLKPGNVMISRRGYVKLMDFGIARLENTERMTRQNSVIGTLEYLSPELIKGESPSKSSDLYAVGVMLNEMITGKTFFQGDTEAAMMYKIAHTQPNIQLPASEKKLVPIIKKLTHRQVAKRYQSTQEVIEDLEKIYSPGKIDTRLLSGKLVPSMSERKSNSLSQQAKSSLSLPSVALPKKPSFSLPFDIDYRILAGAGILSLLIILLGIPKRSSPGSPDPEGISQLDTPHSPESENQPQLSLQMESSGVGQTPIMPPTSPPSQREVSSPSTTDSPNARQEQPRSKDVSSPQKAKVHEIRSVDTPNSSQQTPTEAKPKEEDSSDIPAQSEPQKTKEEEKVSESPKIEEKKPENNEKNNRRSGTPVSLQVSNVALTAAFSETISSETHQAGQRFYLRTTQPTYVDGHLLIAKDARIRAVVRKVRPANGNKKAFLAVEIQAVQAVNKKWLAVNYPEYSNLERGGVQFRKGLTLRKIKLQPTITNIYP